ncbi:MAG TPA: DDE-type integrase/transposase/recombinase [Thermoanaerobaculia bacterium]|nr:DDE-type integrase/transposase/recombinase [Thermoanaerobaculia bacterium]
MNRLHAKRRAEILSLLVEGNSIRSVTRITGVSIHTALNYAVAAGIAAAKYQDETLRGLACRRIECDEIWSFCHSKMKNTPPELRDQFGWGDVWVWTAIDATSKLVPCWLVNDRSAESARRFMHDLASRLTGRIQLSTDGYSSYSDAVELSFGANVDYATIVKEYRAMHGRDAEARYSPAACVGVTRRIVMGEPNEKLISTSYVERQNLSMRMGMRRFTRLTNAFSKKLENHKHAVALYFLNYNFVRIHQTLRCTPAMAAGVTDKLWSIDDVVSLVG